MSSFDLAVVARMPSYVVIEDFCVGLCWWDAMWVSSRPGWL